MAPPSPLTMFPFPTQAPREPRSGRNQRVGHKLQQMNVHKPTVYSAHMSRTIMGYTVCLLMPMTLYAYTGFGCYTESQDTPHICINTPVNQTNPFPTGSASCSSKQPTAPSPTKYNANTAYGQQKLSSQELFSAIETTHSMNMHWEGMQGSFVDSYDSGIYLHDTVIRSISDVQPLAQPDNQQAAASAIVIMPSGFMFNIPFDAAIALYVAYPL